MAHRKNSIAAPRPERYGTFRVVKVLSKGNISLRTVDKLLPLEISSDRTSEDAQIGHQGVQRPKRQAAIKARHQMKNRLI